MAKSNPTTGTLPITRQTTVEWECPFCGNANGIPEITVCACGATLYGSTVTAAGALASAPVAAESITATSDEPPADTGE